MATERGTPRQSWAMYVGGTLLTVVGGFFIKGALGAVPEDVAPLLVIGSVLIAIGALVGGMAYCVDHLTIARRKSRTLKYKSYFDAPWYRREPGGLVFLLAIVFAPVTIALCVVCLTGDVYRNSYDEEGNLQVWGVGNKVAAVLILVVQIGITLLFVHAQRFQW
jgi:hypothetical protein